MSTVSGQPEDGFLPDAIQIDDIPEPARARRSSDLLRLLLMLVIIAVALFAGSLRSETTAGLQEDITSAVTTLPDVLVGILTTLNSLIVLALPIYLVGELAVRRRWRQLFTSVLASILALALSRLFNYYASDILGSTLFESLTRPVGGVGDVTLASFGLFAGVVALVTVEGSAVRPRTSIVVWASLLALAVLFLIDRRATPFALLISVLGGHSVGLIVRYIAGSENERLRTLTIAEALVRVGVVPRRVTQLEETDLGRQFELELSDGSVGVAQVLDPDRGTIRWLSQLTRLLRVRAWVTRSPSLSQRVQVQQAAVPVLMAREAGVRTPRLMAAAEVDDTTIVFVEERPDGLRLLSEFSPTAISDEAISQAWFQLAKLHRAGVAHEGLNADSMAVDHDGRVWLLGLTQGEIAASALRLRLDRAELLLATSLIIGVDRAVTIAEQAIGDEGLANLPALLQPVALNHANRAAVKKRKELLAELRDEATVRAPQSSPDPVKLERLKPRTVISVVALTFAVYVLAGQLGNIDFGTIFRDINWVWAGVAVVASLVTYVGSALTIMPFSPVKLKWSRWLAAQFAAEFVRLVAPAAVGSAGTNARVIQKGGAPTGLALASVGISTLVSFITTIIALAMVLLVSRQSIGVKLAAPSTQIWVIAVVFLAVIALAFAVPFTRRLIIGRLRPMWQSIGPRLLDVLRDPRKLAFGAMGTLVTSLGYAATLFASVKAYGYDIPIAAAVAVYLGAGILGTVAPTPGGIGAVEAGLVAGLSAVGVPPSIGLPAALLYRVVTFWLPTVPGWLSFQWLQRHDAI